MTAAAFGETERRLVMEGTSHALAALRDAIMGSGSATAGAESALVEALVGRIRSGEKRQVDAIVGDAMRFRDPAALKGVKVPADTKETVSRLLANRREVLRIEAAAAGRSFVPELIAVMPPSVLAKFRDSAAKAAEALTNAFERGSLVYRGPEDPQVRALADELGRLRANKDILDRHLGPYRDRVRSDPRFAGLLASGYGTESYDGSGVQRVADRIRAGSSGFAGKAAVLAKADAMMRDFPKESERLQARIDSRMHALVLKEYETQSEATREVVAMLDERLAAVAAAEADPAADRRDRLVALEIEAFSLRKQLAQYLNGRGRSQANAALLALARFDARSLGAEAGTREAGAEIAYREEVASQIAMLREASDDLSPAPAPR